MKLQSYFATFGMVALSVTVGGCTVNTTADNGDAANNTDTGTGATEPDTGTDSGTVPASDAGIDAASCSVTASTTSAACDQCVESMCCSQLEACFGSGATAAPCVELTSCMQACEAGNADAGQPPRSQGDCLDLCAGDGGLYSAADQASSIALLACLGDGDAGANLCGTACGSNEPAIDAGSDSGSDTGSDSGSDAGGD